MDDRLHIVCLDGPSPANYGGSIEMYEKVKALSQEGWRIHLHYFNYRQGRDAAGLEQYCEQIFSYDRKPFFSGIRSGLPYIVRSRINAALVQRLNADRSPVLLEGLHTSGIIPLIGERRVVLRMHNDEAHYYRRLALSENRLLHRAYLLMEAHRLKKYQASIHKNITVAVLSPFDSETLARDYGWKNLHVVPAFHPWKLSERLNSKGSFALYHGNLAIKENEAAAIWLVDKVFRNRNYPFVISGLQPGSRLRDAIAPLPHISLVADPDDATLGNLVREAQVHVLPSMNGTGVKLKLLHALFHGRFCFTNAEGAQGTMLQVQVLGPAEDWIEALDEVMEKTFGAYEMKKRLAMQALYDNKKNAGLISALL